jgi:hypothetical protein
MVGIFFFNFLASTWAECRGISATLDLGWSLEVEVVVQN